MGKGGTHCRIIEIEQAGWLVFEVRYMNLRLLGHSSKSTEQQEPENSPDARERLRHA